MSETATNNANNAAALAVPDRDDDDGNISTINRLRRKGKQLEAVNAPDGSPEALMVTLTAEAAEPQKIWGRCPIGFSVSHISVREAEQFNKDSGEIEGKLRTTFVCPDGTVYATNSPTVARLALSILASPKGKAEFTPPLPLDFKEVPTLSGGKTIVMSVAREGIKALTGVGGTPAKGNSQRK